MSVNGGPYVKDAVTAAKFSVVFPGLGQFLNRHYLKGMLVIGIVTFIMALHFMLLAQPYPFSRVVWSTVLLIGLFIVWELSVFDAYYSAVENRKASLKRHNVQILTTVRGVDVSQSRFQEVAVTKNVSKLGACLIMSTEVEPNSLLSLTFEGKPKSNQARVVWSKETGNRDEHLVGVELTKSLREP
jgi:PilZ domain-containing protein